MKNNEQNQKYSIVRIYVAALQHKPARWRPYSRKISGLTDSAPQASH
jgi:hypothetical protein